MRLCNSNKKISHIIAGILLVIVAIIFIAIALGVVGNHLYIQDSADPLYIGSQFDLVDNSSRGEISPSRDIGRHRFGSIAQSCTLGPFNTEQGSLDVVGGYYDDDLVLPLCIEPDADGDGVIDTDFTIFTDWFVIIRSYGGYSPLECATQSFDLTQKGSLVTSEDGAYYIGWSLDWAQLTDDELATYGIDTCGDCCGVTYWIGVIDIEACLNPGCLDSNQYPTLPCECDQLTGFIPGKEVYAEITTTWCGCDELEQCFEIILAQMNRVPNSRIKFIAS